MVYILALGLGVVAGLRAMLVPAALGWAAYLGVLAVEGTWFDWLASGWAVGVFTLLAAGELVTDQLPSTPSRTVPMQFGARLMVGAAAGAAVCAISASWVLGAVAGILGAVGGTLGGRTLRGRLATRFGRDRPAAFIEDGIAVAGAWILLALL